MKTFLEKWVLLLVVLLACGACDDDKEAQPSGSLLPQFWEVMSQGGYWSEDVRFVYWQDGQLHVSEQGIVEDYRSTIRSLPYPNDVLMEQFYYDPQTYYIHRYVLVSKRNEDPVYRYHPNLFWLSPEYPIENGFYISPQGSNELKERSAMAGVYTNLISVSADEIVMEVPIKSFIYDCWLLDQYDGWGPPRRYYSRLRTTWRRITDPERLAQLESATPFNGEAALP